MTESFKKSSPASQMLPNPHIVEVNPGEEQHLSSSIIDTINYEEAQIAQGVDPRALFLSGLSLRMAESARENTSDERSGLLNPKGLELWFERYKPEKFMVMMCDGRGFGQINNQYGHNVGDKVIEFIGQGITDRLRITNDDRVHEDRRNTDNSDAVGSVSGRWGGDEFISIVDLTGLTDEEATQAQQSVLDRFNEFGTYEDEVHGMIPISIRAVSVLGSRDENKEFSDYQNEADLLLTELTTKEKSETV